jgi:hypothetical protein
MSTLLIVPNVLSAAIHEAIIKALHGRPCSDEDRDHLYHQLLAHYDEHGTIPVFSLEAKGVVGE